MSTEKSETKSEKSVDTLTTDLLINTYKIALVRFKNLQETIKEMEGPLEMVMLSRKMNKTCMSLLNTCKDMKIEGYDKQINIMENAVENALCDTGTQKMNQLVIKRLQKLCEEGSKISELVDSMNKIYNKFPFSYDLNITIEYDDKGKTVDIQTCIESESKNSVKLNQSIYDFRQSIIEYKKDIHKKIELLEQ